MNAILQSFLCGLSFSVGLIGGVVAVLAFKSPGKKSLEHYNEKTVELLRERNRINERIANALEGGSK